MSGVADSSKGRTADVDSSLPQYKYPAGRERRQNVEHTGVEVSWQLGWEKTGVVCAKGQTVKRLQLRLSGEEILRARGETENHKECPGSDGQGQSCICVKITPAAMWRMFWR